MKSTLLSIIIAGTLIGGALFYSQRISTYSSSPEIDNVSIVDGVQIISISAKGGYQPRVSRARAGIPTIVRFDTTGTFDCSSSVRIPVLNISKSLPLTGSTDIDIGTQSTSTLQGMCGMGMYPFEIIFE